MQTGNDTLKPEDAPQQETGEGCSGATCLTLSVSFEEVSISQHPSFHEVRNDWGVIPAHFETVEWDESVRQEWVPENRAGYRPELDGKSLADMWDAEKEEWAIQPPGMEGITSFLRPKHSWSNAKADRSDG